MSLVSLIGENEFTIAHQRIVRSISHATIAHEILLRKFKGKTTQYFVDNPSAYVDNLEDLMVLTALMAQKLALEKNIVNVMVNFSEEQLLSPSFMQNMNAFYDLGLEPMHLSIDITCLERTFSETLMDVIYQLKSKGHPIVIGGFGGLPCDFEYIVRTKPAMVKLSRQMVNIGISSTHAIEVLRNVVGFLRQSGTRVVIEGIETKEHLDVASQCNADFLQGFYFDKANSLVSIGSRVKNNYKDDIQVKLSELNKSLWKSIV